MARKALLGIIDSYLSIIILLNVLDFFEVIGPELDYLKKIISWTMLGYIVYRASPSKVFFGQRSEDVDVLIIAGCFLLIVKNLIWYASVAVADARLLQPFFGHLIRHQQSYGLWAFIAGIALLMGIGIFVALRVEFKERSVMGVLHEKGVPGRKLLERVFMTMLVLFGFFLIVFNMMMEWLAIAVDATILLVALLFYSVVIIRHRVSVHAFLDKVGNVGNEFYRSFIDHFRFKETFLLGIVGLLVLHLLTDIGVFLIPYLTGIHDPLYFTAFGPGHEHVWRVLAESITGVTAMATGAAIIAFLGNIISYIILFFSPAIILYHLYHRRHPHIPRWLLVPFLAGLPAVVFAPLFSIGRLDTVNLVGVDVQTRSVLAGDVFLAAGLVLAFLIIGTMATRRGLLLRRAQQLWVAVSTVFFTVYIWQYFRDVSSYYLEAVRGSLLVGSYFLAGVFFVFATLIILFYLGGLVLFVYELVRRTSRQ